MTYLNSVKLVLKFEDYNFSELVSSTGMYAYGDDTSIDLLSGGMGYVMKQNQYLHGGGDPSLAVFSLDITNQFKIGFWLYPVNPGIVSDSDGDLESIRMPLLDFVRLGEEESFISIYENTLDNDRNFLTVKLDNGEFVASSNPYTIGVWHYFWIEYSGTYHPSVDSSSFKIYLDGTSQLLEDGTGVTRGTKTGDLPSNLRCNLGNLFINRSHMGYGYNITNNYGYIDDIVVFNDSDDSETLLQKVVNYSLDYAIDKSLSIKERDEYGFAFNDPTTLRINSLIDDMSYIYLACNNGNILRGSPLFWEARKVFSDEKEKDLTNEAIVGGDDAKASKTENGFLKISNSIIRL